MATSDLYRRPPQSRASRVTRRPVSRHQRFARVGCDRDFRCWHFSDMPGRPDDVRSWGRNGHPAARPRWSESDPLRQSTGRAQYRVTVSQALEHIRNFVRISRRAVTYPRWEPCARIGLARICAGARGNSRPYRESWTAGPSGQLLTPPGHGTIGFDWIVCATSWPI